MCEIAQLIMKIKQITVEVMDRSFLTNFPGVLGQTQGGGPKTCVGNLKEVETMIMNECFLGKIESSV